MMGRQLLRGRDRRGVDESCVPGRTGVQACSTMVAASSTRPTLWLSWQPVAQGWVTIGVSARTAANISAAYRVRTVIGVACVSPLTRAHARERQIHPSITGHRIHIIILEP